MFDENIKFKYSWRPYQAKVLKEVNKYIADKKINIVAAPGSGKTVLGLELARRLGNAVLILSPTVTIKNQWIDRFVTLFMPEESNKPDWISDNVYELAYFNSITYQGLHYAYKRRKFVNKINEEETDDEVIDESLETNLDVKEYDLVAEIKKNKISTVILDEAHHLKSEWWQSLTKVIEELKEVTIISLTATPPYDVEYNEWKKYSDLCGNIDMEISVPELVQAKNLCPHQDYIYFSYPTKNEKEKIAEYEKQVEGFIDYLKFNTALIDAIREHPYIKFTEQYVEEILENPGFYSSMIIFLNAIGVDIHRNKVRVLGHNQPIPNLTAEWIEILLQNILFSDDIHFEKNITLIEDLESRLNKINAIEKKKVLLRYNSTLKKYFENSLSKLESINKIVETEFANLKNDLRMVILTDFLRKEYLFEEDIEISKIGVFSILLNLINKNPKFKIAILTGSIFMIPKDKKEKLLEIVSAQSVDKKDIQFMEVNKLPEYCIVRTSETHKNKVMKAISTLFSNGEVNIIIGTKSLLGEGWDEPSINSLILASFVGSYILSNQMRGRAIRTNSNPNKTANVWHLVCMDEKKQTSADFEMLKRRFKAFVGIGYTYDVLENGIERIDIIPETFSKSNVEKYNQRVLEFSNNRELMYDRWFEIIELCGGSNIKMSNQIEADTAYMKGKLSIFQVSTFLKSLICFILIIVLFYSIYYSLPLAIINIKHGTIFFIAFAIWLLLIIVMGDFRTFIQCFRALKFIIPRTKLRAVAKTVVKSLCEADIAKTDYEDIKIISSGNKDDIFIELAIDGVTTHENNLIVSSIKEVFSEVENQRYILVNNKKKVSAYYNVPNALSVNKSMAEIFQNNWNKYVAVSKLVYTKSAEGRKILLEARKKTFNYTSEEKFFEKKKTVSMWK